MLVKSRPRAYIWPAGIDPGQYRNFCVSVPADPIYLAAFWHAYEYFGTWKAWEEDDAHTAKDVAAVWRIGIQAARERYEKYGGDCMQANCCGAPLVPLDYVPVNTIDQQATSITRFFQGLMQRTSALIAAGGAEAEILPALRSWLSEQTGIVPSDDLLHAIYDSVKSLNTADRDKLDTSDCIWNAFWSCIHDWFDIELNQYVYPDLFVSCGNALAFMSIGAQQQVADYLDQAHLNYLADVVRGNVENDYAQPCGTCDPAWTSEQIDVPAADLNPTLTLQSALAGYSYRITVGGIFTYSTNVCERKADAFTLNQYPDCDSAPWSYNTHTFHLNGSAIGIPLMPSHMDHVYTFTWIATESGPVEIFIPGLKAQMSGQLSFRIESCPL